MDSIQHIKKRISSITSTKQITQSMRLVSSAKIVKVRGRVENNREFVTGAEQLLKAACCNPDVANHRYLRPKPAGFGAVIVFASDRGLCGGYNINVCRLAHDIINRTPCKVITVGTKARDYMTRRRVKGLERSFTGVSENPFFEDAFEIASLVTQLYDDGIVDSVQVVYMSFSSMLIQEPAVKKLLPLTPRDGAEVTTEPGAENYLEEYLPFYLASVIYGIMLESSLCEQCARTSSMDMAVKNSGDMLDSLTLRYNQARQSAITQELAEIAGGVRAKK